MKTYNKDKGYAAQQVAAHYLVAQGFTIECENFTIAGGEIDLIVENADERVFVEVKHVAEDTELDGYISHKQIQALIRSAECYNLQHPTEKILRVDAIFVSGETIREHFDQIHFYL